MLFRVFGLLCKAPAKAGSEGEAEAEAGTKPETSYPGKPNNWKEEKTNQPEIVDSSNPEKAGREATVCCVSAFARRTNRRF